MSTQDTFSIVESQVSDYFLYIVRIDEEARRLEQYEKGYTILVSGLEEKEARHNCGELINKLGLD